MLAPTTVLNVGPGLMPDFMTAAYFHAILAWPAGDEMVTFHRVSQQMIVGAVRRERMENPQGLDETRARWPQHDWDRLIASSRAKKRPALGHIEKRAQHRMRAAKLGIGLAHNELFGRPAILPPWIAPDSIDSMISLIERETYIADPENVERLVWRKALPIIHLAMATQLMLAGPFESAAVTGLHLQDIEFYRASINLAQVFESVVAAHPKFNIEAEQLTCVRWYE
jgi:hypothetical protein